MQFTLVAKEKYSTYRNPPHRYHQRSPDAQNNAGILVCTNGPCIGTGQVYK